MKEQVINVYCKKKILCNTTETFKTLNDIIKTRKLKSQQEYFKMESILTILKSFLFKFMEIGLHSSL